MCGHKRFAVVIFFLSSLVGVFSMLFCLVIWSPVICYTIMLAARCAFTLNEHTHGRILLIFISRSKRISADFTRYNENNDEPADGATMVNKRTYRFALFCNKILQHISMKLFIYQQLFGWFLLNVQHFYAFYEQNILLFFNKWYPWLFLLAKFPNKLSLLIKSKYFLL